MVSSVTSSSKHAIKKPSATLKTFLPAITLFAAVRERLEFSDIPKAFEGFPIALITAALLSMAFMGFQGMKIF